MSFYPDKVATIELSDYSSEKRKNFAMPVAYSDVRRTAMKMRRHKIDQTNILTTFTKRNGNGDIFLIGPKISQHPDITSLY